MWNVCTVLVLRLIPSLNLQELELLLEQFDEHGDGRITFEEFVQKVQEVMRSKFNAWRCSGVFILNF